jgi:hypothetical protein
MRSDYDTATVTELPPMNEANDALLWNCFEQAREIELEAQKLVRQALIEHKQAGNPIAVWKDGQVVIVPPEEIVIPDDPDAPTSAPRS